MNICLAIMGHEGARATIAEFQPRWNKLGLPILAFVPATDQWPGEPVDHVYQEGENAHGGEPVYRRFLGMCQRLLETEHDRFVIMEYDTVNLSDQLPEFGGREIVGGFMKTFGPEVPGGSYYISLSPWMMSRPMLAALVEAMRMQLRRPQHVSWVGGLLDRWLAVAMLEVDLPLMTDARALPFPFPHLKPLEWIEQHKPVFVHGYKRAADFKHLWPGQAAPA